MPELPLSLVFLHLKPVHFKGQFIIYHVPECHVGFGLRCSESFINGDHLRIEIAHP